MEKHANSKKVWLKRAPSFLTKAQAKEVVAEFLAESVTGLGSYYESSTSTRIGSGMTITEEKLLLPEMLGIHHEDREYYKQRNLFFSKMDTKIPFVGLELEVGLSEDNNKPLSPKNLPLDVADYIRYRHALGHPWTAKSFEEADSNQLKHFYLYDPVSDTKSKSSLNSLKDEALGHYLAVKDNEEKVHMYLTLLGIDFRNITGSSKAETTLKRQAELRRLAEEKAKEFVDVHNEKDFDIKYNIQMMVNTGVLSKIGMTYVISESGQKLGSQEDTILYFKATEVNASEISLLMTKMQEGLKANKRRAASKV